MERGKEAAYSSAAPLLCGKPKAFPPFHLVYIAYNFGVTAVDKKAIPFFFFLSPDYFFPGEDDDRWREEEIKEH